MRRPVITATAVAVLLLATGSASYGQQPRADAPCTGQLVPNRSFERGATGWTAGPRMVVTADEARPAHTGRAYATFGGLDVTRSEVLRTTVAVPAGCSVTLRFWARATTTEVTRGDSLNVGLYATPIPPKTIFPFAFDRPPAQWTEYTSGTWTRPNSAAGTATVSFVATETAGNGTTAFDVDDVTITLS
jgi:hypothetical protein